MAGLPCDHVRRDGYHDHCFGRGVTVGYNPLAYADAVATVKAFLTDTIARGR